MGLACICVIAGRWEEVGMFGICYQDGVTALADGMAEECKRKGGIKDDSIVLTYSVSVTGDTVVKRNSSMV